MSNSPSAKLPRINFDMQQDICLVNKRLQSLVVVEILSSPMILWPVVPSVAHLDLSSKLCSLLSMFLLSRNTRICAVCGRCICFCIRYIAAYNKRFDLDVDHSF